MPVHLERVVGRSLDSGRLDRCNSGVGAVEWIGKKREEVQSNLLLILLTPIAHSKPTRVMIPCGVSTGTGTPAGIVASATTIKPGDPLSSPSVAAS